jgi:hypothetical protein
VRSGHTRQPAAGARSRHTHGWPPPSFQGTGGRRSPATRHDSGASRLHYCMHALPIPAGRASLPSPNIQSEKDLLLRNPPSLDSALSVERQCAPARRATGSRCPAVQGNETSPRAPRRGKAHRRRGRSRRRNMGRSTTRARGHAAAMQARFVNTMTSLGNKHVATSSIARPTGALPAEAMILSARI